MYCNYSKLYMNSLSIVSGDVNKQRMLMKTLEALEAIEWQKLINRNGGGERSGLHYTQPIAFSDTISANSKVLHNKRKSA